MTQDKILATRTAERRMQPSCSEQDHSSGPTCGFVAFPEVGPGPLSVPHNRDTHFYCDKTKTRVVIRNYALRS